MDQSDRNHWARASERDAREAEKFGDNELARGHRAEAAAWRRGKAEDHIPRPVRALKKTD